MRKACLKAGKKLENGAIWRTGGRGAISPLECFIARGILGPGDIFLLTRMVDHKRSALAGWIIITLRQAGLWLPSNRFYYLASYHVSGVHTGSFHKYISGKNGSGV